MTELAQTATIKMKIAFITFWNATYDAPRAVMLTGLIQINIDVNFQSTTSKEALTCILLQGDADIDADTNTAIFNIVHIYISSSNRFV